ncbi:hypothetical protein H4582DRAFT_2057046 [Lactarius indigo]|nr:hypothetical protein H4582DRAFT_2057046 [Lactarius indigo]
MSVPSREGRGTLDTEVSSLKFAGEVMVGTNTATQETELEESNTACMVVQSITSRPFYRLGLVAVPDMIQKLRQARRGHETRFKTRSCNGRVPRCRAVTLSVSPSSYFKFVKYLSSVEQFAHASLEFLLRKLDRKLANLQSVFSNIPSDGLHILRYGLQIKPAVVDNNDINVKTHEEVLHSPERIATVVKGGVNNFRLSYDGTRIDGHDTPGSLDMEDNGVCPSHIRRYDLANIVQYLASPYPNRL